MEEAARLAVQVVDERRQQRRARAQLQFGEFLRFVRRVFGVQQLRQQEIAQLRTCKPKQKTPLVSPKKKRPKSGSIVVKETSLIRVQSNAIRSETI